MKFDQIITTIISHLETCKIDECPECDSIIKVSQIIEGETQI